jgi:hypothetical protein
MGVINHETSGKIKFEDKENKLECVIHFGKINKKY